MVLSSKYEVHLLICPGKYVERLLCYYWDVQLCADETANDVHYRNNLPHGAGYSCSSARAPQIHPRNSARSAMTSGDVIRHYCMRTYDVCSRHSRIKG